MGNLVAKPALSIGLAVLLALATGLLSLLQLPGLMVLLPLALLSLVILLRHPLWIYYAFIFSLGLHEVSLGGIRITEALMPLVCLVAAQHWWRHRVMPTRTPLDIPVFLLLAGGGLSLFDAEFLPVSLVEWIRYAYAWIVLVMCTNMLRDRLVLMNSLLVYLASCVFVVATGIYGYAQLARGDLMPPFLLLDTFYRLSGTFLDPNFCASFLIVGFFLLLFCADDLRNRLPRGAIPFLIVLIALGILATLSRSAYIALAIGLTVAWLLKPNWKVPVLVFLLGTLIGLVPMAFGTNIIGDKFVAAESDSGERTRVWEAGLRMVADKPLTGIGVGAFGPVYQRYKVASEYRDLGMTSHNTLLGIWAEMGVLGLVGAVSIFARFFQAAYRHVRQGRNDLYQRLAVAALCCGTALFFQGFFLDLLTSRHVWFLFALGIVGTLPRLRPELPHLAQGGLHA